ncbi:MAG: hypothetical protein HQK56_04345 [Deltaproteobacteria bacterium]|nr:hypothetical protein [Deltaproteobacteria bacterium]
MSVLLSQHWDIIHGKHEEYAEFVKEKYIYQCKLLGFHVVGGFYVVIGPGPRVLAVMTTEEYDQMEKLMRNPKFKDLTEELKHYTYNHAYKILTPTGRVPAKKYTVQKSIWKFTQYYDIVPGAWKEYADFVVHEYIPTFKKTGLLEITGGWNVVLGDGPKIVSEFSAPDATSIGQLFDNDEFRRITKELKTKYVTNYFSRMLCPTERFGGPA